MHSVEPLSWLVSLLKKIRMKLVLAKIPSESMCLPKMHYKFMCPFIMCVKIDADILPDLSFKGDRYLSSNIDHRFMRRFKMVFYMSKFGQKSIMIKQVYKLDKHY